MIMRDISLQVTVLNDYKPVAFTSLIMKYFEKLMKDLLLNTTQCSQP